MAASRFLDAGITRSAVLTAGSLDRESWGSSGRRSMRMPSSAPLGKESRRSFRSSPRRTPQFERDLEHQPVPQSCARRERLRERHQALCIAPWTDGVTNGVDICLFQRFDTIRCTSARSQRVEDEFNPVSLLGEFSEFERFTTSAVLAIQRPLQEVFENGQMLIERPCI